MNNKKIIKKFLKNPNTELSNKQICCRLGVLYEDKIPLIVSIGDNFCVNADWYLPNYGIHVSADALKNINIDFRELPKHIVLKDKHTIILTNRNNDYFIASVDEYKPF